MRPLELKHPNGFVLGVAQYQTTSGGGWRFFPNVAGRMPSRRAYPSADACLPPWAKRRLQQGCSFLPKDTPVDAASAARAQAAIDSMKAAALQAIAKDAEESRKAKTLMGLQHIRRCALALHQAAGKTVLPADLTFAADTIGELATALIILNRGGK